MSRAIGIVLAGLFAVLVVAGGSFAAGVALHPTVTVNRGDVILENGSNLGCLLDRQLNGVITCAYANRPNLYSVDLYPTKALVYLRGRQVASCRLGPPGRGLPFGCRAG
jgi:hypothetical protein